MLIQGSLSTSFDFHLHPRMRNLWDSYSNTMAAMLVFILFHFYFLKKSH